MRIKMKRYSAIIGMSLGSFALGGFFLVSFLGHESEQPKAELQADYPIERHIRYGFTVSNTTGEILKNAELWVYGPVRQTSHQLSTALDASHPFDLQLDPHGNQLLHFTFRDLPPYGAKVVNITATVALSRAAVPIKAYPDLYKGAERFMEVGDSRLVARARALTGTNERETARKAYSWVGTHVQYAGYVKEDRGALYAYLNKKGDCTEYMYLFAALCRINGLPARGVGGYVYKEDAVLRSEDFHNWVEVYVDGAWQIVDPQNGRFMEEQEKFLAMRIIAEQETKVPANTHRFAFSGEGLSVKMN